MIGYGLDDRGSLLDRGRNSASYHTPGSVQRLISPHLQWVPAVIPREIEATLSPN